MTRSRAWLTDVYSFLLAQAIIIASGCASSRVPTENELVLRARTGSTGGQMSFAVRGDHVIGPRVDMKLGPDFIDGMLNGQQVRFIVRGNEVLGSGDVVVFHTSMEGGERLVNGVVSGRTLQLRIGPTRIEGNAGAQWNLQKRKEGIFEGGGMELRIAPSLLQQIIDDVRLTAIFTLSLASSGGGGFGSSGITSVSNY